MKDFLLEGIAHSRNHSPDQTKMKIHFLFDFFYLFVLFPMVIFIKTKIEFEPQLDLNAMSTQYGCAIKAI